MEVNYPREKLYLLFGFWIILPFLIQFYLHDLLRVKFYTSFNYEIIKYLERIFPPSNSSLVSLLPLIVGLLIICLIGILFVNFNWFRKIIFILGPIVGLFLIGFNYYLFRSCFSFDCIGPYILSYLIGFYFLILISLFPIILTTKKSVDKLFSLSYFLVGITLILIFGSIWSFYRYPENKHDIKNMEITNNYINTYRSTYGYLVPGYLPSKTINKPKEGKFNSGDFAYISEGVKTIYECKGKTPWFGLTVYQGPKNIFYSSLIEVNKGMSDWSKGLDNFKVPEIISIANSNAVYQEFHMVGTTDLKGAKLVFDNQEVRIGIQLYETCLNNPGLLKEEIIKVADSF